MSLGTTVFAGVEYTITAHTWGYSVTPQSEKDSITWKLIKDGKETELKQVGEAIKYKFKKEEQGKRIIFIAFDKTKKNNTVVSVYVSKSNVILSWLDKDGKEIKETPYGADVYLELLFQNNFIYKPIHFAVTLENKDKSFSKEILTTENAKSKIIIGKMKIGIPLHIDEKWRNKGSKETLFDLYISIKVDGISYYDPLGSFFGKGDVCIERLLIRDFFVDENGFVINPRVNIVEQKDMYSIESFEDKTKVHAIVLHRTNGKTGDSALSTAKSKKQGGHFTIEGGTGKKTSILSGKDGEIYQFGSLKKSVSHVGKIRPRPENPAPEKKKTWKGGDSYHSTEVKKNYPERFPYNGDSIGIEVVGTCSTDPVVLKKNGGWEAEWEPLTKEQVTNTAWVTNGLLYYFSLDKEADIYVHEQIRSKTWDEGGVVLRAVKPYLK